MGGKTLVGKKDLNTGKKEKKRYTDINAMMGEGYLRESQMTSYLCLQERPS